MTSETTHPVIETEVEQLEEKTAPQSSTGFFDRKKHQFVSAFLD